MMRRRRGVELRPSPNQGTRTRASLGWISLHFIAMSLASVALCGEPALVEVAVSKGEAARGLALFDSRIRPVLREECFKCHSKSARRIKGGLELDSPTGIRRGGDSGPILVAHSTEKSPLIRMLRHEESVPAMPPKHKLADDVISAFEEWVRLGAPDSRQDTGRTARDERMEAGKGHWAFEAPKEVEAPEVQQSDWPRDEIDRFVLARMEAAGVQPVADASRRTLARRVYFDLTGLPPSPRDVEQFVSDDSPEAFAELVDRLLDSPRFGERWGRHWLDVVRYAESSGMEFNFTYPHAWPFRDYVIDAVNDDRPFDEFLREQLAGDLMPTAPGDSAEVVQARRVAPSILAFVPKRHNSGGTEFRMDVVDGQIDTVFRSMLGLTVSCARCHDHKFDPIPTRDYYALAGIFLSTEPLYGTIQQKYSNSPTELVAIGADAEARHAAAEEHAKTLQECEKLLEAKRQELSKLAGEGTKLSEVTAGAKAEIAELESRLAALKKSQPPRPAYAMSARDRDKPVDTKIAIRGNFRERGDLVPRGFLSTVSVPGAPEIDTTGSGRRELAEWISSPENPLTARVMVNRIWHHLFGRGLVSTVDNFGIIGSPPSHPRLLDALALRFMREGWSVKRMVRAILLTRTYQLSSAPDATNAEIDPGNRLLWRASIRRLEAEAIRDAMLTVSGRLDLERPSGSTVTGLGDQLVRGIPTEKIQPPSDHRSVYLPVIRDYVPELFDLFDFPSPSLVSGRRSVTNVPSQALYLRNSEFAGQQAKHAAERLLERKDLVDDAGRIGLSMSQALARQPTASERDAALKLVRSVRENESIDSDRDIAAWTAWFLTLFATAEFRYLVDIE